MTRKFKTIALALVAVFALGAIVAQAASAFEEHTFNSEIEKTVLTADNDGLGSYLLSVVSKGGTIVTVSCTTASFSGTQTGKTADEITLHPTFGKANTFGEAGSCSMSGLSTTVTTTGCNFVLDSDTAVIQDAVVSIECETGKALTASAGGCSLSFGSEFAGKPINQNLGHVSYANEGSGTGRDVKITSTLRKLHWTATGMLCVLVGLNPGETGTNGQFSGVVTAKGFEDVEGPFVPAGGIDKDAYKEGNQVGFFLTTP